MPHNGIKLNLHRGCGTCGSSVSFYTRGWPFKSCHRYIFVVIIFCPVYFYKEKMPRFEIVQYTLSLKVDFIIKTPLIGFNFIVPLKLKLFYYNYEDF